MSHHTIPYSLRSRNGHYLSPLALKLADYHKTFTVKGELLAEDGTWQRGSVTGALTAIEMHVSKEQISLYLVLGVFTCRLFIPHAAKNND